MYRLIILIVQTIKERMLDLITGNTKLLIQGWNSCQLNGKYEVVR